MKTEKEKMLSGELYMAADPELVAEHLHAQDLTERFNGLPLREEEKRQQLLAQLLGSFGENIVVKSPFHCGDRSRKRRDERHSLRFPC